MLSDQKNNPCIERDPTIYNTNSSSFEKYLSWTNEKIKIAEAILHVVGEAKGSLLDIGAGNGILTNLLAPKFNRITAIEPSPQLFASLKSNCSSNKYTLVNTLFQKTMLQEKFDIIMACHSLKFIPNQTQAIAQIKNLLTTSGVFLLIDHNQESDFVKFYHRYNHYILKEFKTIPIFLDYADLLSTLFNIKKITFAATLSIPTIDDVISIFDFIYDVELSKIKVESLIAIKQALSKEYGNGQVNIDLSQTLYVCSKR